jgi:hypothetical protein
VSRDAPVTARGRWPGRLAWLAAALPPAAVAVALAVPALRARLLGPPLPPQRPDAAIEAAIDGVAQRRPAAERPRVAPRAPAPATARPSATPGAAGSGPLPPAARAAPAELDAAEASRFLDSSYRPQLPRAVGPLRAEIGEGRVTLEAEVDLQALRQELATDLPEVLGPLLRGRPDVRVTGLVLDSGEGIVRLRVERVWVAGIPVPDAVLSRFLAGEREERGLAVDDPLQAALFLPPGYAAAAIQGNRLVLKPAHGP